MKTGCIVCGAETSRLVLNEPLCESCDGTAVTVLTKRVAAARQKWLQLLDEADRVNEETTRWRTGEVLPHTVQNIKALTADSVAAFWDYHKLSHATNKILMARL